MKTKNYVETKYKFDFNGLVNESGTVRYHVWQLTKERDAYEHAGYLNSKNSIYDLLAREYEEKESEYKEENCCDHTGQVLWKD